MRIPGTVNAKGSPEVLARILDDKGQRYNPSDFEDWIADTSDGVIASVDIGDFTIDANAEPPFSKIEAAKTNDPDFAATWERKRADMKDQSPSAYDLSLATRAAFMGWSDQEIVNLMIANRRHHEDPPKLRADYFKMTLLKARAEMHRDQAIEELEQINAAGIEEERDGVDDGEGKKVIPEDTRETILRTVNKTLIDKVQITDAIKYQQDPRASYQLRTPHGDVHDLVIEDLLSPTRFNARVADATGWISKPMKGDKWRQVAQSILRACRVISVQGSGDSEEMEIIIESYLKERGAITFNEEHRDRAADRVRNSWPVVKDGLINLSVRDLCKWMDFNPGMRIEKATAKRIGMRMHKMGARQNKLSVRYDGRLVQGRYWALPVDKFEPGAFEG
jgi:phage pi2 protein 07